MRYKLSFMANFPDMFCYQCEQTKSRRGCVTVGVCGKSSQVSALQDLLLYALQGIAVYANRGINMGVFASEQCDDFLLKAMFRYYHIDFCVIHKFIPNLMNLLGCLVFCSCRVISRVCPCTIGLYKYYFALDRYLC